MKFQRNFVNEAKLSFQPSLFFFFLNHILAFSQLWVYLSLFIPRYEISLNVQYLSWKEQSETLSPIIPFYKQGNRDFKKWRNFGKVLQLVNDKTGRQIQTSWLPGQQSWDPDGTHDMRSSLRCDKPLQDSRQNGLNAATEKKNETGKEEDFRSWRLCLFASSKY